MIFRKIILNILYSMSVTINNDENDCKKYERLEVNKNVSIKRSELPPEFSEDASKVVNDFIGKTIDLNYEIALYFDYITGEILKCKIGSETKVELKFEENEFNGKHVASIHNHTKDMYTPPSDKNFAIFSRKWEDYELIAWINGLWILKAKLKDEKLTFELKTNSLILFRMVLDYYSAYSDIQKRNEKIDEEYGKLISNYINHKNIKEIQLNKKEYNYDY